MAKFGYKIKGVKKIKDGMNTFKAEILSTQVDAVREATLMLHRQSVLLIQDNASGKPEIRYGPKRVVLVSKPGTPPNTDTGRAAQSIKFDFKDQGLIGRVGTNLRYLKELEFGTRKIAARPWLSTALRLIQKDIKEVFQKSFKKKMKKDYK